jgi:hypothetical protein
MLGNGTKLRAGSPRSLDLIPGRGKGLFSLHDMHTADGSLSDLYTMGTGAASQGVKRQGPEADDMLHLERRLRILELYLRSPYIFMGLCLINYAQE